MRELFRRLKKWVFKNSEWFGTIGLILAIYYLVPPIIRLAYPQAAEFGIEMVYIPLLAGLFMFIGLLFIWGYLGVVFPRGKQMLDEIFNEKHNLTEWENVKLILSFFALLVFLFGISLLAVTGISAIM